MSSEHSSPAALSRVPPGSPLEVWAATPTPFDARGELDLTVVPAQARHLVESGVSGAFVAGTTGEFPALSVDEREALVAAWVAARPAGLVVAAQVGSTDLRTAQRLARHAESLGVDMIAAVAPFYGQTGLAATVSWLAELAQAAPGTPLCYYHIPSMTGSVLLASDVVAMASERVPTLRAVKFTDSDLVEFDRTRSAGAGVRVFLGRDELLPAAMAFGADAVIGSHYNGLAPLAHATARAWAAQDHDAAFALHRPFREVAAAAEAHGGVSFIKELLNALGPDTGSCRPPWGPVDDAGRTAIEALLPSLRDALAAQGDVPLPGTGTG
jgi:N-acetylneuraminate lyase